MTKKTFDHIHYAYLIIQNLKSDRVYSRTEILELVNLDNKYWKKVIDYLLESNQIQKIGVCKTTRYFLPIDPENPPDFLKQLENPQAKPSSVKQQSNTTESIADENPFEEISYHAKLVLHLMYNTKSQSLMDYEILPLESESIRNTTIEELTLFQLISQLNLKRIRAYKIVKENIVHIQNILESFNPDPKHINPKTSSVNHFIKNTLQTENEKNTQEETASSTDPKEFQLSPSFQIPQSSFSASIPEPQQTSNIPNLRKPKNSYLPPTITLRKKSDDASNSSKTISLINNPASNTMSPALQALHKTFTSKIKTTENDDPLPFTPPSSYKTKSAMEFNAKLNLQNQLETAFPDIPPRPVPLSLPTPHLAYKKAEPLPIQVFRTSKIGRFIISEANLYEELHFEPDLPLIALLSTKELSSEFWRACSALANTNKHAVLLLGMKRLSSDNYFVKGIKNTEELIDEILYNVVDKRCISETVFHDENISKVRLLKRNIIKIEFKPENLSHKPVYTEDDSFAKNPKKGTFIYEDYTYKKLSDEKTMQLWDKWISKATADWYHQSIIPSNFLSEKHKNLNNDYKGLNITDQLTVASTKSLEKQKALKNHNNHQAKQNIKPPRMTPESKRRLLEIAEPAHRYQRLSGKRLHEIIIEICKHATLSLDDIAYIVNRRKPYLQMKIIPTLLENEQIVIDEAKLYYAFP